MRGRRGLFFPGSLREQLLARLSPGSLRSQLLVRFALILVLVVALVGLLQTLSLRRAMYRQLQALLESRLHNVPVGMLASSDTEEAVDRHAIELMKALIDRDVTLLVLDGEGEVLADSEGDVRDWYNARLMPLERTPHPLPVPRLGSLPYRDLLQSEGFPTSRMARLPDGSPVLLGFVKLGSLDAPAGLIQLSISAQAVDALVNRQMIAYGMVTVGALLMGGWLASRVLKRTLKPLRQLNEAVDAQHADDLGRRIPETSGQEEIDRLSQAYNRLLSRLQDAFSRERDQREGMRRFLSDVAHELKTPLTSIHGFSEVLLMGAAEDEAQLADSLGVIRSESERLGGLVQDLLDLANLEQGTHFQKERGDLAVLVGTMKPQLHLLAGARTVEINLPEEAACSFQEDRMRQVILNLFQNAVAHTDSEKGTICLAVAEKREEDQPGYLLRVGDNGCGMSQEQLGHVFDRFWRADAHRSRKTGGNGLGLSIVKSIVGLHGGQVGVESAEGQGTVFSVWIPVT